MERVVTDADGDPEDTSRSPLQHLINFTGILPPVSTTDVVTIQLPTMTCTGRHDTFETKKIFVSANWEFPEDLDDHFFWTDSGTTDDSNVQGKWKLLGGVFHIGQTVNSGHYISIVRECDDNWLRCDDNAVTTSKTFQVRHWSSVCLVLSDHVMMNASLITVQECCLEWSPLTNCQTKLRKPGTNHVMIRWYPLSSSIPGTPETKMAENNRIKHKRNRIFNTSR